MKRILFLGLLVFLLPIISAQCLTSSEEYSVEVVVPNYTLFGITDFARSQGVFYRTLSQYSPKLIAQYSESDNPAGLSVRLQVPTELNEVNKPYIRFVSFSGEGISRTTSVANFAGWTGSCTENGCSYEKSSTVVSTEGGSNQLVIEFNHELDACDASCSGVCFAGPTESKCIDLVMKRDLDQIIRYVNVSDSFDALLGSYRSGDSEYIVLEEIIPTESYNLDWREAIKQELVFLSSKEIISLTPQTIERIALKSRQGLAGHNYRLVYDAANDTWVSYNRVEGAILETERDCSVYELPTPVKQGEFNTFYLIPLILVSVGVFMLIVLVIVGRLVSRPRPPKKHKKI